MAMEYSSNMVATQLLWVFLRKNFQKNNDLHGARKSLFRSHSQRRRYASKTVLRYFTVVLLCFHCAFTVVCRTWQVPGGTGLRGSAAGLIKQLACV